MNLLNSELQPNIVKTSAMQHKTILLLFICLIVASPLFAQIRFENGYFITNDDQLVKCQIRDMDWDYNPVNFKYRINESGEILEAEVSNVKEFGIDSSYKYRRAKVFMDMSSMDISKISLSPDPEWQQHLLFLKILVEGKATLYSYSEHSLRRFFFSSGDTVKQLIFKEYGLNGSRVGTIGTNNKFRQQLLSYLWYPGAEKVCRNIGYYNNELVKYFKTYNTPAGDTVTAFREKQKRDIFNLNVTGGLNALSISANDYATDVRDTDFESKINPRFGLEAEFVLPFNKNKWSIILESAYQSYSDSTAAYLGTNKIKYRIIDFGVILRHYFFLNKELQIYGEANLNSLFNKDFNSAITMPYLRTMTVFKNNINLGLGAGVRYNRVSFGIRYFTPQRIYLNEYPTWTVELSKVSFVIGVKVID